MPKRSRTVRVLVTIPRKDRRVYLKAHGDLRRLMGNYAPDVQALLAAQLTDRDVTGVVDSYLDGIGWPAVVREISVRKNSRKLPRGKKPRRKNRPTEPVLRHLGEPSSDPINN